jgi:hypothetical protein
MAYNPILAAAYAVGRAIRRELFNDLVSNQSDFNSRVTTLEGGANKLQIYNEVITLATATTSLTTLEPWKSPANFNLIEIQMTLHNNVTGSGYTGFLEMDVLKSSNTDFSSAATMLSTKPKIDFSTAVNFETSDDHTAGVFDTTAVSQGEYLKLDFTQIPLGLGYWSISLIGEIN